MSLSAGENVLPSMGSEYATGGDVHGGAAGGFGGTEGRNRRKKGLVKAGVEWLVEWVGETGQLMGFVSDLCPAKFSTLRSCFNS